jgi:hypothetical protein
MRIEDIKVGDVLIRRIRNTGFFHYGLVIQLAPLLIIDHDYNGRHKSDFEYFRWGEPRLWVATFEPERKAGAVLRAPDERVSEALRLHKEATLYCPETNNCEHFVRQCIFTEPQYWYSPQVGRLRTNDLTLGLRLFMAAFQTAPNISPPDSEPLYF